MDQAIRNKLRNVVTQCRKLLEDAVAQVLQGQFGIYPTGKKDEVHVEDEPRMTHLIEEDRACRRDLLDHFDHIKALGYKPKDSLAQLVREVAFTHLNRLCAYKMMEARAVVIGGRPFREAVSRGLKSQGFLFYLAEHPEDEKRYNSGHQETAYRHFLDWLGATLSEEIGVLFSPNDPANRLYPPQRVLDEVLDLINTGDIKPEETELQKAWPTIWSADETIGWVYQYFTPKELRDQARKESAAPRNSYELAFRNQFFTPRYVVEFLTDNTLGRTWYEMRMGNTRLKEQCRYLVRRPDEVFLSAMTAEGHEHCAEGCRDAVAQLQKGTEETFPPFSARGDSEIQRMIDLSHCVSAYERQGEGVWDWFERAKERIEGDSFDGASTQEILDVLFLTCRGDRHGGDGSVYKERWFVNAANEVRRRALTARKTDLSQAELLKQPVFIPFRPKRDPRELKILDPACGSGHFLLYCFDLLQTIYEEAYDDPDLGEALKKDYSSIELLRPDIPRLILANNLHGIDIDLRATQIAALALWLRCQRAYQGQEIKKDRPRITRSNIVCAEPMPGEKELLEDFLKTLRQDRLETLIRRVMQVPEGTRVRATQSMVDSLCELVRVVWERMRLAGEAGSLLKIEEELQEAVRVGQEEWEEKQPLFRITEFSLTQEPNESYLQFIPGEGVSFWQQAERLVMAALHEFAAFAGNGHQHQRRLFVADAARGFALVDVCQNRFDVILMNPPFGQACPLLREYLAENAPLGHEDLGMAMVACGVGRLNSCGLLGALTSRTYAAIPTALAWRDTHILGESTLTTFADLGYNVLDTAMVEAASYVIAKQANTPPAVFISALESKYKEEVVSAAVDSICSLGDSTDVSIHSLGTFRKVPGRVLCYWIPEAILTHIPALPTVRSAFGEAKSGLNTGDDYRFLRLAWEVNYDDIGTRGSTWALCCKGGEYVPFYDDVDILLKWSAVPDELLTLPGARVFNTELSFRLGVVYPMRTTSDLSPRPLAPNCCFNKGAQFIGVRDRVDAASFIALSYTRAFKMFVDAAYGGGDVSVSGSAAKNYTGGVLNDVPVPLLAAPHKQRLCDLYEQAARLTIAAKIVDENSRFFVAPLKADCRGGTLKKAARDQLDALYKEKVALGNISLQIDEVIVEAYGFDESGRVALRRRCGEHPFSYPARQWTGNDDATVVRLNELLEQIAGEQWSVDADIEGSKRLLTKKGFFADRVLEVLAHSFCVHPASLVAIVGEHPAIVAGAVKDTTVAVLSYCLGCVFGRWDVRFATGEKAEASLPGPFDPLPICAPGMLRGSDGLPTITLPQDYPIRINQDGLLPDDAGNPEDGIERLQGVLEMIWPGQLDAIEAEVREVLGVKSLRDYFRKPGNGGFWSDHIARYSKSRRKAPIYWLLQSSKKNYAIWLYYHRLDKDILFKALVKYVEPKIRLEENRLDGLRGRRTSGEKSNKKLDKEIEKQEGFLSELRDFEDKLRRTANLHLEPDLNDGVVFNIAPLWELVPWREAKDYWEELLEGKYEWSSIGKQLREKGLVKC